MDNGTALKLNKLYRTSDGLQRCWLKIADALFAQTWILFDAAGAVIFYDVTNTHLTGSPTSLLAKFERSKQRRNHGPLVTLALAIDRHGFPRRSKVLAGNISEPETLIDALDRSVTADEIVKPTVIMDAGICATENLEYRRQKGHHWITVNRSPLLMVAPAAIREPAPDTTVPTKAGYEAYIWQLETFPDEL